MPDVAIERMRFPATRAVMMTTVLEDRGLLKGAAPGLPYELVAKSGLIMGALRKSGASILITRVRDSNDQLMDGVIRLLAKQAPRLAILALATKDEDGSDDLLKLQEAGVSDVIFDGGQDFGRSVAYALKQVSCRQRMQEIAEQVAAGQQPPAAALIFSMLGYGHVPLSLDEHIRYAGLSNVRAAERIMQAAGGPPPDKLRAMGRVLGVSSLFETTITTTSRIAAELQFPSPSSLWNTLHTHLGMARKELTVAGGSEHVRDVTLGLFAPRG